MKYCKIVQDLLPNYIENLTDEETNEFIENHIKNCKDCEQVLKDMNSELGDLNLQKIYKDREIDYLKKRKIRNTILICITIIVVLALSIFAYKYFTYTGFAVNEDGKIDYLSPLFTEKNKLDINNVDILITDYTTDSQKDKKGDISNKLIAFFDENNICMAVKVLQTGFTDDILSNYYTDLKQSENLGIYTNITKNANSISYNINIFNGLTKEETKDQIKNRFGAEEFIEW